MSLRDMLDMLVRRRAIVLRLATVGLAVGVLFALVVPPMYRASATVTVDRTPPVIELAQPGPGGAPVTDSALSTAPGVSTLAVLAKSTAAHDDAIADLGRSLGAGGAAAALRRPRIEPVINTDLLRISVDNRSPKTAADAANALATGVIGADLQSRRARATQMRQAVEQQFQLADGKLRASEDALAAFKAQHGSAQLGEQASVTLNKLAQLEAQRVDVQLQRQETQARIAAARDRLAAQARIAPTKWVPSPLITTLQNDLANEEIELSGLSRQFTPKYPAMADLQAKIQETKRRLDAEMARSLQVDQYGVDPIYQQLIQQMRQDEVASASLDAQDRALAGAIAQYETQMRQLPARELEQARLTRDAQDAEQVHQLLAQKLQQARIAEASIGSPIRLVDAAKPPQKPLRPRWFGILVGALAGLVFGVGTVLLKEQVDDPIKSPGDAERLLDLPVLGSIPRKPREDPEIRGPENGPLLPPIRRALLPGRSASRAPVPPAERWRSQFAESFRYLRTNLLCMHRQPVRTLLVTSPGPGEDKEIVAANLAIVLAQAGQRVWLVEADLRRPALDGAWTFLDGQHDGAMGLADLLAAGVPEEQVVVPTAVENLWFVPAGAIPPNPAELMGSLRMRAFLEPSAGGPDVLILDTPPVLPVSDAAVVAPLVDGVLLVVGVGRTPREAASRARWQLEAVGANVLGIIATGVATGGFGAYDRYYADYYGAETFMAWHVPGAAPAFTDVSHGAAPAMEAHEVWKHLLSDPDGRRGPSLPLLAERGADEKGTGTGGGGT